MATEEEKKAAEDLAIKMVEARKVIDTHGDELAEAKGQLAKIEGEVKEIQGNNKEQTTLQESLKDDISQIKVGYKALEESQKAIEELVKLKLRPTEDMEKQKSYLEPFNKQLKYYAYHATKDFGMAEQYMMTEDEIKSYSEIIGEKANHPADFIKRHDIDHKAMATTHMPRAGYLVTPPMYMSDIIDQAILEISPMQQFARQQTLPRNVNRIQWPVQTAHGVFGWTYEQGTAVEDETAAGGKEDFVLKQCYAMYKVTRDLLNFSTIDLASFLRNEYARAIAKGIGTAIISGSGVGTPEGVLTNSSIATVNQEETTAITKLDYLLKLHFDLKAYYRPGARYCANSLTAWHLAKIQDGESRYILSMPRETPEFRLFGHTLSISEDMPDIASASSPVIFGNWGVGYLVVNSALGTLEIVDIYSEKETGKVAFILYAYIDGGVLIPEAFKKLIMSET
jgi:HK97 family phage major capsid protein